MRYELRVWISDTSLATFTVKEEALQDWIDFFFERNCKILDIQDA